MTALGDLTAREREVLAWLVAGKSNKAIAAEIRVSPKTIEFHLDRIYTKIGVRGRLLATLWAIDQGLATRH